MATKKCMKCGGSMKKYATGGQALNKAKGFAKPTTGGDNVSKQIYGVPNAGPTGPNRQGIDTMKKGGATKSKKDLPKAQKGFNTGADVPTNVRPLKPTGAKIGVGATIAGAVGTVIKAASDKRKAKKKEKETATAKAKFGASVNVQRGYPGKIRSASDQGYTAVGMREPARTKFAKGGFPDLNKDGKVTKADILKGRGVIKKKGGEAGDKKWIQKAINPEHKGYCTPMTKPTCTPKRKALAMTLKKIAKNK